MEVNCSAGPSAEERTVAADGKQNSGLVNFIPEYYCVYHLFHLLEKWLRRPKTGIKDGFKELEHKIP